MTFKMKARRAGWLLVVAVFAFGIVSAIRPHSAFAAYGLISTRSIKMSSSASGATNTIYTVGFTTATTENIAAIAIHFCANNPIIGDTCSTTPSTGTFLNTNYSTLTVPAGTWSTTGTTPGIAAMTIDATKSNSNTVVLTRSATSVGAGTNFAFDLGNGSTNGITNPTNVNTTFFGRITIYTLASQADFSTDTNAKASEAAAGDAGGVALSTANVLNVTAKVQEALTFCLYTAANCALGGNAVKLGDSNNVLAATNQAYTDATPKFDLASNALGGVAVRMKGDTLTSGSFTISAVGGSCTADSTATNTEQFGVRVVTYGTGQYFGGATTLNQTPDGSVNDFSCLAGNHKFDPAQTNTTYGQPFVRTIGATDVSTTNFELAAKAANTTEAGVYTTTLQFIATATY